MHKRLYLCVVLSLLTALLLCGCGGDGGNGSSAVSQPESKSASSDVGLSEGKPLDNPEISEGALQPDLSADDGESEISSSQPESLEGDVTEVPSEPDGSSEGESDDDEFIWIEFGDSEESSDHDSISYEDYADELITSNSEPDIIPNGPRPRD